MILKIFLAAFFVLVLSGVAAAAASGLVHVPLVSSVLFSSSKADLSVELDPELGRQARSILEAQLQDGLVAHTVDLQLTGPELTSLVYVLCQEQECPFENFQAQFEGDEFHVSARGDIGVRGDVTAAGTLSLREDGSLDLELKKLYLGNLPIPGAGRLGELAERQANQMIAQNPGIFLGRIEIAGGSIRVQGTLPFEP